MCWQIRAPSTTIVLQALCIFSGILFGVQMSSCYMTSSIYHRTDNTRLTDSYANLSKVTAIACCSRCHSDSSCKSVTYNPGSQECWLSSVSFTNVDSNSEPNDEWATYSDNQPRDCGEIDKTGNFSSGVFEIYLVGVQVPVKVYCDFDDQDGPWTVIQRRVDGTVEFYRNYTEYQAGFGNLSGNFWLGLEKISAISLQDGKKYCLKVTVVREKMGKLYTKYWRFQVMNATTGYRLKFESHTGMDVNALYHHNGNSFSTFDRDMDNYASGNCAMLYTSGWWFNKCYSCNLNGKYGTNVDGIRWLPYQVNPREPMTERDPGFTPTFASMKIKEYI